MPSVEVSRTLVKSPPELWAELEGERLSDAVGDVRVRIGEPERALSWEGRGASGTARLEPAGWGTRVILTADVAEATAWPGLLRRFRRPPDPGPSPPDLERRLHGLLDALGADHRKPFRRG